MSGWEAFRRVLQIRAAIRVILITGQLSPVVRDAINRAGAAGFPAKPWSIPDAGSEVCARRGRWRRAEPDLKGRATCHRDAGLRLNRAHALGQRVQQFGPLGGRYVSEVLAARNLGTQRGPAQSESGDARVYPSRPVNR